MAIKPTATEPKQVGLLIIPDTAHIGSRYKSGVVMFTGAGANGREVEVSVNDMVYYKKEHYPVSEGCDVCHNDDILYVYGRKCAVNGCMEMAKNGSTYCEQHHMLFFED